MSQLADLLLALALCFAPIWLLLNLRRAQRLATRAYALAVRGLPEPVRTWVYAYHGKRALRAIGRK